MPPSEEKECPENFFTPKTGRPFWNAPSPFEIVPLGTDCPTFHVMPLAKTSVGRYFEQLGVIVSPGTTRDNSLSSLLEQCGPYSS